MALAVYSVLCHLFRSLDDSVECLVLNTPMAFILQSVGRKVTKTEGLEEGHVDASDDDRECWTGYL